MRMAALCAPRAATGAALLIWLGSEERDDGVVALAMGRDGLRDEGSIRKMIHPDLALKT